MSIFENEAGVRPKRVTITNLVTGSMLTAQSNPTRLEEAIGANWVKLAPPGQGHEPLHFSLTENLSVSLELEFRAYYPTELHQNQRARRLMHAWHYPRNAGDDFTGGGAPTLLFFWPGLLSIVAVSRKLKIVHTQFNRDGQSVRFTASLELEEIRSYRTTTDRIEEDNDLRLGGLEDLGSGNTDAVVVRTRR